MRLPRPSPRVFGCLALFTGLSFLVVRGVTLPWDRAVVLEAGRVRSPLLVDLMLGVTMLNEGAVPVVAALGMCVLLWRLGGRRPALTLAWAALSGELVYVVAKASFHRPRPDLIPKLAGGGWYSYPSGHTMLAPIVWSLGLVLLARELPRAVRPVLLGLAVLIPFLMAASRVVLGVHYPSDVLGALALGGAWMFLWLDASSSASASRTPSTT
jgi:undecaprenyl-diphosphatase